MECEVCWFKAGTQVCADVDMTHHMREDTDPVATLRRTPMAGAGGGPTMEVLSGKSQIHVDASPEDVYAIVSDVSRTPEWSPEVIKCRWADGRRGVGARFKGRNRSRLIRWTRTCEVVAADPGREFAFRTLFDRMNKDSTTWRYTFEPKDGGTVVTESYDVHDLPTRFIRTIAALFGDRPDDMTPHMETSLDRIKAIAERG